VILLLLGITYMTFMVSEEGGRERERGLVARKQEE
jgi:hypothetical protein